MEAARAAGRKIVRDGLHRSICSQWCGKGQGRIMGQSEHTKQPAAFCVSSLVAGAGGTVRIAALIVVMMQFSRRMDMAHALMLGRRNYPNLSLAADCCRIGNESERGRRC